MSRFKFYHFHPERIAWTGVLLIVLTFCLCLPFVWMMQPMETPYIAQKKPSKSNKTFPVNKLSLGLADAEPLVPVPNFQKCMNFSFAPPRPTEEITRQCLMIQLSQGGQVKRVELPGRVDLEFFGSILKFSKLSSPLQMDLQLIGSDQIECKIFIAGEQGELEVGRFVSKAGESPIQKVREFSPDSHFRFLGESRWVGRDLLKEGSAERIVLDKGPEIELSPSDWLYYEKNQWHKSLEPKKDLPIAHIQSSNSKGLVFEGWDEAGHVRFVVPHVPGVPFKTRAEDLITSIRIRSEKQISCMIEKQCMVLRVGDWVLKGDSKWKILRKKEDKKAFLEGELTGDLLILDQILQKQAQKRIIGRLFNTGRTQMLAIDLAATGNQKKMSRKGRAR